MNNSNRLLDQIIKTLIIDSIGPISLRQHNLWNSIFKVEMSLGQPYGYKYRNFLSFELFPFLRIFVFIMNVAYWNIHGLKDKFEDNSFVSLACKYDIICLSETMLSQSPGNLPGFSSPYIIKPSKYKRKGRPSGGMLIYSRPNIKKNITKVKQNNFCIWLKMDKNHIKCNRNIFLCFVYVKPYTRKYKERSESMFRELENDIAFYCTQGHILLCGDFNARTGGLIDYISDDSNNENFKDCPTPSDYEPDLPIKRNNLDEKSNLHGTLLTDICRSSQLRILNGRFLGDSLGYFTFYNKNGQSTVDYMIASSELYYRINNFTVSPPSYLSDHCLISTYLHFLLNDNSNIDEIELLPLPGRYKWSDENKETFVDSLLDENSVPDIMSLNNLLDNDQFNDIDFLIEKTTHIFTNAANKSVHFKPNKDKSKPKRNFNKAIPKKEWMSNDGLLLRKELRSLANRLAKDPKNNALRLTFCNCRREYNKLRNKLKKDFFNSIIKDIDEINPKNTKDFWKSINKYKKKENVADPIIPIKSWEDHYKNLLISEENNSECKITLDQLTPDQDILNIPFSCKEIKDGINKLKKGKAGGA